MEDTYFLVELELNDGYAHSCEVIHSSRLVRRPTEIHTGQLITVTHNGDIRRAKIIKISDNRESLDQAAFNLRVTLQEPLCIDNGTSTPSLDTTIQRIRQKLEQQNYSENSGRFSRASINSQSPELYTEQNTNITPQNSNTQDPYEFFQLQQDLTKAQMQFLEINNFVDSLKDKVDLMAVQLKRWESAFEPTSESTFKAAIDRKQSIEQDENFTSTPKTIKMKNRNIAISDDDGIIHKIDGDTDMVGIGSGSTKVPIHVINQIDWRSPSIATRKLLMGIFSRKILATHSLTGKSSPAFTNKPAKLQLDPIAIKDIITTVSNKCNINASKVRGAITTKCADENKMYRKRETKNMTNKRKKNNQENIEPEDLENSI